MKRTIKVFLGGEPRWVGTLHYDAAGSRERSAFAYAETWLGTADRLALDPEIVDALRIHGADHRGTAVSSAIFPHSTAPGE